MKLGGHAQSLAVNLAFTGGVAADGGVGTKPRGMSAPGGGATRARKSFAISIMGTQWTSACVLTHSMKRS